MHVDGNWVVLAKGEYNNHCSASKFTFWSIAAFLAVHYVVGSYGPSGELTRLASIYMTSSDD